jgi:hypothetical protein
MHLLCAATGKRWTILIFCLVLLSAFLPSIGQSGTASTVVAVIPGKVVVDMNDVFAVDIWIYNVTDMLGWQIMLTWNTSMLYCVKARVNTPAEWGGMPFDCFNKTAADVDRTIEYTALQFGRGINNTQGTYIKAENGLPLMGARFFSGSLAIVTLWFQSLQTGTTTLYFKANSYPYRRIMLMDRNINLIPYVDYGCVVEVREPINIPTQHAAWLKK